MTVICPPDTSIPLDTFLDSLSSALGINIPPDLADLIQRLRFASGPEIPGLLVQLTLFVPQSDDDWDDAPVFSDYERF